MDFFGPSLLKVSKKQRTKDSATDTQSSEDEPSKAERYPGSKQVIKGPSYAELEMNKSPHVSKMVSAGVSHTGRYVTVFLLGIDINNLFFSECQFYLYLSC